MTLCHDVTGIGKDFKGPVFHRGHVIEPEDVERLLDLGQTAYLCLGGTSGRDPRGGRRPAAVQACGLSGMAAL